MLLKSMLRTYGDVRLNVNTRNGIRNCERATWLKRRKEREKEEARERGRERGRQNQRKRENSEQKCPIRTTDNHLTRFRPRNHTCDIIKSNKHVKYGKQKGKQSNWYCCESSIWEDILEKGIHDLWLFWSYTRIICIWLYRRSSYQPQCILKIMDFTH